MKDGAGALTRGPGPRRRFSALAGGPYTGVASMKPLLYSVLPRPAHPTRDGLSIRNYHLLSALAESFRVRAAALVPPHLRGTGEYPAGVEVEEVPQAGRALRQAAAVAESALSGEAYPALLYRSRALSSRLARWASREQPAWIVAHSYHVAPAAFACGARSWVDFHNVDSEIWRRMGETAGTALARAAARWQAPRVERLERRILQKASGASCVSERDAVTLAALGGTSPLVVSNGVDLGRYAFRAEPAAEEIVFFVGDLTWPPRFSAAEYHPTPRGGRRRASPSSEKGRTRARTGAARPSRSCRCSPGAARG